MKYIVIYISCIDRYISYVYINKMKAEGVLFRVRKGMNRRR